MGPSSESRDAPHPNFFGRSSHLMATSEPASEFESLLSPWIDSAFATAYHLTRNRENAEDLVQESVLQAYRAFHTFRHGSNFRAWFLKVLTNRFLQNCRKQRREPEISDLAEATELYLYSQSRQAGLHFHSPDPAGLVLSKLDAESVSAALGSLPEEYRVVCTLYFSEELSYLEIAEIVDCPVGTVRSRLHRGRKILQRALWKTAVESGIVADLVPAGEQG